MESVGKIQTATANTFNLLSFDELCNLPEPEWLLEDMIELGTVRRQIDVDQVGV